MTRSLTFTVYGDAKPQGSKRALLHRTTKKPIMIEAAGEGLRTWRGDVKETAQKAVFENGVGPLEGPLYVTMTFHLRQPKKPKSRLPVTRPDIDKLARALLDALGSAGVFRDDAQVVSLTAGKVYTTDMPHAEVTVGEVEG